MKKHLYEIAFHCNNLRLFSKTGLAYLKKNMNIVLRLRPSALIDEL